MMFQIAILCISSLFVSATMVHTDSIHPSFRLPLNVVPRHYDLSIITYLEPDNFSFEGNVWIKVECKEATDTIKVHARDLTFVTEKVTVNFGEGEEMAKSVPVASTNSDLENEFFVVKTQEPLIAGQMYDLHLPFQGKLKEDLIGYYRSSYVDQTTNSTKWLTVTHFEPSDARQAFPCFDEPQMKATFTIRLGHKDTYTSISNMPLESTTPFEGKPGWVWNKFEKTVVMSTYLIAYMVSEFEYRSSEPHPSSHVKFRVWARRDVIQQAEFASKVGPHFLSFYEDFFSVPYPLPKLDLLAIPDFKLGGMENWGIITFREASLLFDDKSTSSTSKLAIANVVAHELAHMWFGNLVTMYWWTDLWLKEGFATYMAGLNVHHEFPEWNSLDLEALSDFMRVLYLDSLKSSHPVSVPINHPREISQIFDTISYCKGSFLLRMMSLFLGEEVFRHGISEYLKKHQFGNAEKDELWASLTEQAHRYHALPANLSMKEIMDTWTLQTGYPLITIERDYNSHKAHVSQRRFLAVKSNNPEDYKYGWWVPLSYSTSKEPNFTKTQPAQWLSKEKSSMELDITAGPDDWLIVNNKAAGLYRVNYDRKNWDLLIAALNSPNFEGIDVLNRAQLIIDSMDLAEHGELPYGVAFKLISYLHRETKLLPWKAALSKLGPISSNLSRTAKYGMFKEFMRSLMSSIAKRIGRLDKEAESFEEGRLVSEITQWTCPMAVGDCHIQAIQLFNKWRSLPDPANNNPVPKDVRRTVYSLAVNELGEEAWDFLWQRYNDVNLGSEKNNILIALTATKEIWLLNRYLEWTLDEKSGIRKQDAFIIFMFTAQHEVGYYVAQTFFFRNIKKISEYYGSKSSLIGKYFTAIANQMISTEDLEQLKRFAEKNKELLAPASLSVSQGLESVQVNINWMERHYDTTTSVLEQITIE